MATVRLSANGNQSIFFYFHDGLLQWCIAQMLFSKATRDTSRLINTTIKFGTEWGTIQNVGLGERLVEKGSGH
jgi:hypothetical protein